MGNRLESIKFYNAAIEAHNDGTKNPNHLTSAYQLFSSACLMDPTFFEAWFQSGNNNSNLERYDAAVANWRCALECASTLPERAMALVSTGRYSQLWRPDYSHPLTTCQMEVLVSKEAMRRLRHGMRLAHG